MCGVLLLILAEPLKNFVKDDLTCGSLLDTGNKIQ